MAKANKKAGKETVGSAEAPEAPETPEAPRMKDVIDRNPYMPPPWPINQQMLDSVAQRFTGELLDALILAGCGVWQQPEGGKGGRALVIGCQGTEVKIPWHRVALAVEKNRLNIPERPTETPLDRQSREANSMLLAATPLLNLMKIKGTVILHTNQKVSLSLRDQRGRIACIDMKNYEEHGEALEHPPVAEFQDGFHIVDMIEEFAFALNKFGLSIDTKSMRGSNRVIISNGTFDMVVHYRGLMQTAMNLIVHKMLAEVSPRMRMEELYTGLDPAELRAISIAQSPLTQEALGDQNGRVNIPPEEWVKSADKGAEVQAEVEREQKRQTR